MVAHIVRDDGVASSNLVTSTIRDGFLTVSFLLQNYAKMLKIGLNTEVLSTATIKLRKLEAKKQTRHKQSHKQSFKLSIILDRKIIRNPETSQSSMKKSIMRGCVLLYVQLSTNVLT